LAVVATRRPPFELLKDKKVDTAVRESMEETRQISTPERKDALPAYDLLERRD
jgi:hypothetical protein